MKLSQPRRARLPTRPALDITSTLAFAASPVFALMGAISATTPTMMICSGAGAWMPISDMALMYLLMSGFHLSPWLGLLPRRTHQSPKQGA